jgi:hypothetical protein
VASLLFLASCSAEPERAVQSAAAVGSSALSRVTPPTSAAPASSASSVSGVPVPGIDRSVQAELARYHLYVTPVDPRAENPRFTAEQALAAAQATNAQFTGELPYEMSLVRFTNTAFGAAVAPGSSARPTPAISGRAAWLVLYDNVQSAAAGPPQAGGFMTEKVILAQFFDADDGTYIWGTTLDTRS